MRKNFGDHLGERHALGSRRVIAQTTARVAHRDGASCMEIGAFC
jgi:hypothetical protein